MGGVGKSWRCFLVVLFVLGKRTHNFAFVSFCYERSTEEISIGYSMAAMRSNAIWIETNIQSCSLIMHQTTNHFPEQGEVSPRSSDLLYPCQCLSGRQLCVIVYSRRVKRNRSTGYNYVEMSTLLRQTFRKSPLTSWGHFGMSSREGRLWWSKQIPIHIQSM